jgi:disulfide bond formation protein DsbB
MNRTANISLTWVAFIVTLILLVQQMLLRSFTPETATLESFYHVGVMAVMVSALALIIMPRRRVAYLLGFLVCAALMGWALWLQFGEDLEPCPLCMFQRVAVCAVGLVFLIAFLHNPRRGGAIGYALATLAIAGVGAALATRQVWLQALPPDQVPACGMGLSYMMDTMPFIDVILRTLQGSGECADTGWVLLDLSIAGWSLVFFIAMIVAAFAVIRRD